MIGLPHLTQKTDADSFMATGVDKSMFQEAGFYWPMARGLLLSDVIHINKYFWVVDIKLQLLFFPHPSAFMDKAIDTWSLLNYTPPLPY